MQNRDGAESIGAKGQAVPIQIEGEVCRVGQDRFHAIDHRVTGLAFALHNDLGNQFAERIYRDALGCRCRRSGLSADTEVRITVTHGTFKKCYRADLLVDRSVVYEVKAVDHLLPIHRKQALNYLLLADLAHGKLLNMGRARVGTEFVSTRLTMERRMCLSFSDEGWKGDEAESRWLKGLLTDLLTDWGGFLAAELYYDAVVHFLGPARTRADINVIESNRRIGQQPARLLNAHTAFKITALTSKEKYNCLKQQLRRFLEHTELSRIEWINLNHHTVQFQTIDKSRS